MAIHILKTWREPFNAVWRGIKAYEIRINDRDYQVGDSLVLQEWERKGHFYTDREIAAKITYMTDGGDWGLSDDICVLSLGDIRRFDPVPPSRLANGDRDDG